MLYMSACRKQYCDANTLDRTHLHPKSLTSAASKRKSKSAVLAAIIVVGAGAGAADAIDGMT